jgi:hypothetical protein
MSLKRTFLTVTGPAETALSMTGADRGPLMLPSNPIFPSIGREVKNERVSPDPEDMAERVIAKPVNGSALPWI